MARVTISDLAQWKSAGQKWAMLTSYDQISAEIIDSAGIPVILVGDSAGNNFYGYENTIPVTVDEMISCTRAVVSSTEKALIVADFPFGSYEDSAEQALATGVRFFKEAKPQAVKLEGGAKVIPQIKKLIAAGIPVMGHLGLTPQSVHALGGFKVQGRGSAGVAIIEDAKALQNAGVFALVLEMVPADLARQIALELTIPVIGIGAGVGCDAQVLVWTDLVGFTKKAPKLAKAYADLRGQMLSAVTEWAQDVKELRFPGADQTFN